MDERISSRGQITVYLGKCFRIFKHEKGWKNLISAFIIVAIVCLVTGEGMFSYPSDTQKGAFALACACIWIGIFNSIQSVCRERAIVKREHRTGLNISSYILAHTVFEAVLCMGECLLVTLVVVLRNLENSPGMGVLFPGFIEIYIDFFLILFASDMMGLLVSCVVKTKTTAMTVMPFLLILQLVFAGTIFELEGAALLISNLTVSRWGLAAICVTSNVNGIGFFQLSNDYMYSISNQLRLWLILLAFIAAFIALSIAALSLVDQDKR